MTFFCSVLQVDVIPDPFDYNGHIERIKRLRRRKDAERLREAREVMNSNFPLSSRMLTNFVYILFYQNVVFFVNFICALLILYLFLCRAVAGMDSG